MKMKAMLLVLLLPLVMDAQPHYERGWSASAGYIWNMASHGYGIGLTVHYHTTAYHEIRGSCVMKREYFRTVGDGVAGGGGLVPLSTYLLGASYGHGIKIAPSLNCFLLWGVQMGTEVSNRSRPQLADGGVLAHGPTGFLIGPIMGAELELVLGKRICLFNSFRQKFLFISNTGLARIEFQSGLRYYL